MGPYYNIPGIIDYFVKTAIQPLDFLKTLFVDIKKRNAHTTRTPPGLVFGSLARCGRPFLGSLARSARLDPSACSLNARGSLSVTVSRTIS